MSELLLTTQEAARRNYPKENHVRLDLFPELMKNISKYLVHEQTDALSKRKEMVNDLGWGH